MEQQVTPYLLYEDGAAAIEFLKEAFGFRELRRTGSAGGMHAELEVAPDGGRVYLGQQQEGNESAGDKTSFVYVVVDAVDSHHTRAKDAGARIIQAPSDQDYGYRHYGCVDPQGHQWYFAQPIAEETPDG